MSVAFLNVSQFATYSSLSDALDYIDRNAPPIKFQFLLRPNLGVLSRRRSHNTRWHLKIPSSRRPARRGASQGHTSEVFGWVSGKLEVKAWCDRERGLAAHHQRISIGRRFSYCFRGDHAARARPVLYQHRLTQTFRHFLGDNPGTGHTNGNTGAILGGPIPHLYERIAVVVTPGS
jgi:hypothetical protein